MGNPLPHEVPALAVACMESLTDLFGRYRLIKATGKPLDERATIIKWFADTFKKDGKVLALRLSYIKDIGDLYALKSQVSDRLTRDGLVAARKYFYWATESHSVHDERIAPTNLNK